MEIVFSPKALLDIEYWKKSGNKTVQKRIQQLIVAIQENPFGGIGKPEALKYDLAGRWSRRITHEHRLIYTVTDKKTIVILSILSLRGHYLK